LEAKAQFISHLPIQPSAAYVLAAPSVPDEARRQALERAHAGDRITRSVADEIIARARDKLGLHVKPSHRGRLRNRFARFLATYGRHWNTPEYRRLADELLNHIDSEILYNATNKNGV
jgi:hypothetical protein